MPDNLAGLSAELLIASMLVRDGWNIYSPHRDRGFDFVATKKIRGRLCLRAIQVRGCYPVSRTKRKPAYGKIRMKLTELSEEMALVLPFYEPGNRTAMPACVAFIPRAEVRKHKRSKLFHCQPATISAGRIRPRKYYRKFFGKSGLRMMSRADFHSMRVNDG
jgi:hypothetical protein